MLMFVLTSLLFLNGCNPFNPGEGALEGVVQRQTGNSYTPLSDVLISISGSTSTTSTDHNGYFLLNDIPAGKRTLTLIKEGYITLKLLNVYIEPNIINKVYFGEPIVFKPKEDTALYNQAMEYFNEKNYSAAMDTFLDFRETYPESPWADDVQYYIANIYEIKRYYISARDEYSLLLFYYPSSPWAPRARLGIGNCFYQTADYFHARIQYQSVIDNYPLSDIIPEALYQIAFCNRILEDFEESINSFQRLTTLYPESNYAPPAQYFIGEIYYKNLGDRNLAIDAFQASVNNYPFAKWLEQDGLIAPCSYFYIGICYKELEMWQEAIDTLQIIINEYPGSTCWGETKLIACVYYYMGNCYEKKEMWQEAIDAYQLIIDEYPDCICWGDDRQIIAKAQQRIDFIKENYL